MAWQRFKSYTQVSNGVTSFAYTWEQPDEAIFNLRVVVKPVATGVAVELTEAVDYTVTGRGVSGGGTIELIGTYAAGLLIDDVITLESILNPGVFTQFTTPGSFSANAVNNEFVRRVLALEDEQRLGQRSVKLSPMASESVDMELPEPVASTVMGFNGTGLALELTLLTALSNFAAASQVEAEAGSEVALRSWSPLRIAEAIAALAVGEANPDLIPQAEAEAGVATTERVISAERMKQAIDALSGAVVLARIAGSTDSTIQHMQDIFHSAGVTRSTDVTDAGSNTINVPEGTGLIRATDSEVAELLYFDWEEELGLSVPSGTTRYIAVQYNAGSPNILVSATNDFDATTTFHLATVVNEGGTIHVSNTPHKVGDHASAMILRSHETLGIQRDNVTGGLILGETGTRNVTVTAGNFWDRLAKFPISLIDTSGAGRYDRYFTTAPGVHTLQSAQSQWDNTQFNNVASGLVTLGANKYSNEWFYLELDGELMAMYGNEEFNSLAEAQDAQPPADVPDRITHLTKLIGRIIFKKSDATAQEIESSFDVSFGGAVVTDHGSLAGLSDDDHEQYYPADGSRPLTGSLDMGGNDIVDANGNELVTFTTPASAVNNIEIENAIASKLPIIRAVGGDTNLGFELIAKGTGDIRVRSNLEMFKSLFLTKGVDVASDTALPLITDGNFVDVTGTTTITSMNSVRVGTHMTLQFDDILTLTHDAADLILPGGVNITTKAGDVGEFVEYASGDWLCTNYQTAIVNTGPWFVNLMPGADLRATIGSNADASEGEEIIDLHKVMLRTIKFIDGPSTLHSSFQFALPEDYDGGPVDLDVYLYKESGTSVNDFVLRIRLYGIEAGFDLASMAAVFSTPVVTPPIAAEEVFIETFTLTPAAGAGPGTMMSGILSRRPADAEDALEVPVHCILVKVHQ